MSYYLVAFIRKINSLYFTTNAFLPNSYGTRGSTFVYIYSFRSSYQRYSLKKGVFKNFAKFLRTPFLQNIELFKTRVIKSGELLSTFQKKQKNEFICVKLVTTFIFCDKKVPFIAFLSKISINHYLNINSLNSLFEKFHLLRKSLAKLILIFCGDSRCTAILISLTTKSQT